MINNCISLNISYKSNKYLLEVNDNDPLFTLKDEIEKLTHIPVNKQTLIFKGKQLTEDSKSLNLYQLKDKNKLLLIGEAPKQDESKYLELLNRDINKLKTSCDQIFDEIHMIEQGFIAKSKTVDFVKDLRKRIQKINQTCNSLLSKIESDSSNYKFEQINRFLELLKQIQESLNCVIDKLNTIILT